jgi:hypothetical protein
MLKNVPNCVLEAMSVPKYYLYYNIKKVGGVPSTLAPCGLLTGQRLATPNELEQWPVGPSDRPGRATTVHCTSEQWAYLI